MQNEPLVSVVVPCYNHEQFVQECIQSIIDQDYQNIELIIIDDGSKDNSVQKIEEMREVCEKRFVRFEFRHRPNKGLCATLNEALDWCEGLYYTAIASDDIWETAKTAIQVAFLEGNEEYCAVFGGAKIIDKMGVYKSKIFPSSRPLTFKNIILSNYTILAPTQMIRMNILKNGTNPPYPEGIEIEDLYMWLKLSKKGRLKNLSVILSSYRMHDNNTMNNLEVIQKGRMKVLDMFKNSHEYDRAKRIMQFMAYLEVKNNQSFWSLLRNNPKLLVDFLFYKKIFINIVNKVIK